MLAEVLYRHLAFRDEAGPAYVVLSASTIFILAARNAGSTPPTNPMVREKRIDL